MRTLNLLTTFRGVLLLSLAASPLACQAKIGVKTVTNPATPTPTGVVTSPAAAGSGGFAAPAGSSGSAGTSATAAPVIATASKPFDAAFTTTITQSTPASSAFASFHYTTSGVAPTCNTGKASTAQPTSVAIPAATTMLMAVTCSASGTPSKVASAAYVYDATPPVVGGVITSSAQGGSSIDLAWPAATDDTTPAASIKYAVYQSLVAGDMGTVAAAESRTNILAASAATLTLHATGLSGKTAYYFAVVAQDQFGKKSLYPEVSLSTVNNPPTSGSVACSGGQAVTVCRGCSLPVLPCSVVGFADPDAGDMGHLRMTTSCAGSISLNATPAVSGTLGAGQVPACSISIFATDGSADAPAGPNQPLVIAVTPTDGILASLVAGAPTSDASCNVTLPIDITRVAGSPAALLDSGSGHINSGVTSSTEGSVSYPSGTQIATSLLFSSVAPGTTFAWDFSGSSTFGSSVTGSGTASLTQATATLGIPGSLSAAGLVAGSGAGSPRQADFSLDGTKCASCTGSRPELAMSLTAEVYAGTTCVISGSAGNVRCWGDNSGGNTGDGAITAMEPNPVYTLLSGSNQSLNRLSGVVSLASSDYTGCVVLASGDVMCWGDGQYGGTGDGTTSQKSNPGFVLTSGSNQSQNHLTGATAVASGTNHSCALLATSEVMCWGYNGQGRLGDGTQTQRNNAVYVLASGTDQSVNHLTNVVQVSVGYQYACGVLGTGEVVCWGNGAGGQVGAGGFSQYLNPVYVLTTGSDQSVNHLTGAARVTAGPVDACAVMTTGTVQCWGVQDLGALGNGQTASANVANPVAVMSDVSTPLTGIVQVALGQQYGCALRQDGQLTCWGEDSMNNLGRGNVSFFSAYPVFVLTAGSDQSVNHMTNVVAVAAGRFTTCAVRGDQSTLCWGDEQGVYLLGAGSGGPVHYSDNPVYVLDSGSDQAANLMQVPSRQCTFYN